MQYTDPPTSHQCFDEYVFSNFYDGVTLTVQDLTETVGHPRSEKRFYHIMMEGTNAMNLMEALAADYLRSFYYPLQRLRDDKGRSLELPQIDRKNMGWLPLLQGSLHASLTYYALAEEQAGEPLGSPTCTPQIIVINPLEPNQVLFIGIMPALHAHPHPPTPPVPPAPQQEEKKQTNGTQGHDRLHNDPLHKATSDGGQ